MSGILANFSVTITPIFRTKTPIFRWEKSLKNRRPKLIRKWLANFRQPLEIPNDETQRRISGISSPSIDPVQKLISLICFSEMPPFIFEGFRHRISYRSNVLHVEERNSTHSAFVSSEEIYDHIIEDLRRHRRNSPPSSFLFFFVRIDWNINCHIPIRD